MPIIEGTRKIGGLGAGEERTARAEYDFAVDGGAVGAITLRGDSIPAGAIITDALLVVATPVTSGGAATVAVNTEAAGDIQTAAVVTGAPWSTATPKRAAFTSASAPIRTTVARPIVATVAVAALTAGKFTVLVTYVELA